MFDMAGRVGQSVDRERESKKKAWTFIDLNSMTEALLQMMNVHEVSVNGERDKNGAIDT